MITDANALREARDGWDFVRDCRNVIVGNCDVAAMQTLGFNQSGVRDIGFNLLLASAFSVLEEVLRQLRDEGKFSGKDNRPKPLMADSRGTLPWLEFALVDRGREDRNQSIHERRFLSHGLCRDYIAAIEREMHHWGILTKTTPELWHW
jgi:hypothetical protein